MVPFFFVAAVEGKRTPSAIFLQEFQFLAFVTLLCGISVKTFGFPRGYVSQGGFPPICNMGAYSNHSGTKSFYLLMLAIDFSNVLIDKI